VAGFSLASGGSLEPVSILAAGSLQRVFTERLSAAVDPPIHVEAHGSAAAARLVAEGRRDPDIVALADPVLFSDILQTQSYTEFATNALALATADSEGGRAVANADRWFTPIVEGQAAFGRTDPALDPLGYRTLFALELGAGHYGRSGLRDAVVGPGQIYPETALLSHFETGGVDAAIVYQSMAIERDYDWIDLPSAVDLGDPSYRERYAGHSYELPDGTVVHGDVISYAAALRDRRTPARSVFDTIVEGSYLSAHGFGTLDADSLPTDHGRST
jgi:molybdate/tungstate transport system substrate-binding protein